MYYSNFTDTPQFWILAIFNFILFVVFLRMAWNIAQLRKGLVATTSGSREKEIKKLKFKGKSEEALELYFDELFEVYCKKEDLAGEKLQDYMRLKDFIEDLNGEVPEVIVDYMNKHKKK